ncbi:hypothetical protein VNI00_005255 [Paramarasmius palmivorus]|uniref:DUF6534 domain-containing protein n=1 Tax=Paramarasmius palmivorus TaxID=297713 RepID=A0AAW0DF12_9AGAR
MQIIMITYDGWDVFAARYGDLTNFDDVHHLWFSGPVLCGIGMPSAQISFTKCQPASLRATVSVMAQLFYANRIMTFSTHIMGRLVAGVITIIAIIQCCAAIDAGVQALRIGRLSQLPSRLYVVTSIWLSGAATCDILISGSMTWFLAHSGAVFKETKDVFARIIRLTIETGLITALFAVLDIILFLGYPHNNYHVVPTLCLGKIYSNALLVVLNNRARIADARAQNHSGFTTGPINFSLGVLQQSDSVILSRTSAELRPNVQDTRFPTSSLRRETVVEPPSRAFCAGGKYDAYGRPLQEEV